MSNEDTPNTGPNGGSEENPSSSPETAPEETRSVEVHRPWLPVAIASGVAAAVLVFLMIPGVLRYPETGTRIESDEAALEAQRRSNEALEKRAEQLRNLLEAGVCVADGEFRIPDGSGAGKLSPSDMAALPPPAPEATPVPKHALPEGETFEGNVMELLDQATVFIAQKLPEGVGTGTGFFVAPNLVMTNKHVVSGPPDSPNFLISKALGRPVGFKILAADGLTDGSDADFALLELNEPVTGVTPLVFAPEPPPLTHVIAAGFPGLYRKMDKRIDSLFRDGTTDPPRQVVTNGIVSANQPGRGVELVAHTAQVTPGNSGGPLIDYCGRVVGINTFIIVEEVGRINYALASEGIRDFLSANGVTPSAATAPCVITPPKLPAPAAEEDEAPEADAPTEPLTGE